MYFKKIYFNKDRFIYYFYYIPNNFQIFISSYLIKNFVNFPLKYYEINERIHGLESGRTQDDLDDWNQILRTISGQKKKQNKTIGTTRIIYILQDYFRTFEDNFRTISGQ